MKKIIMSLVGFAAFAVLADVNVIPQPNKVAMQPGTLALSSASQVELLGSLKDNRQVKAGVAEIFKADLRTTQDKRVGITIPTWSVRVRVYTL